ncbi:hypothetical protein ACN28S_61265 [Cystobacter fuscus]
MATRTALPVLCIVPSTTSSTFSSLPTVRGSRVSRKRAVTPLPSTRKPRARES